ncbi:MAG: hypothetical protein LBV26_01670 [Bacteroidales bacterium]|jgi:hypothetical protein|nr:hypothetical protein [Bacteroidales bacterium]
MATAALLKQIYHLPVHERIVIAERIIHSIRTEKNGTDEAVALMANEYCNNRELTVFTELDTENFYLP